MKSGVLTEKATWRWCKLLSSINHYYTHSVTDCTDLGFFINLPIGAVLAVLLFLIHIPDLTVKEPFSLNLVRKVLPELDLFGFALFAPASVMFLLALQFGGDGTHAWNSSMVIGLFCGAGVTIILFVLWEIRSGDSAMIPGSVVKQRIVWASTGHASFLLASSFVASYYRCENRGALTTCILSFD